MSDLWIVLQVCYSEESSYSVPMGWYPSEALAKEACNDYEAALTKVESLYDALEKDVALHLTPEPAFDRRLSEAEYDIVRERWKEDQITMVLERAYALGLQTPLEQAAVDADSLMWQERRSSLEGRYFTIAPCPKGI